MARAVRPARQQAAARERADEGFAMSSPVALMSAAAVVLAGVASSSPTTACDAGPGALAAGPAPVERKVVMQAVKVEPTVKRSDVYVSVYNNSNITGLAGTTAPADHQPPAGRSSAPTTGTARSRRPRSTTPSGSRTRRCCSSKDLGIQRVIPPVDPMLMDRLTLILTSDFA